VVFALSVLLACVLSATGQGAAGAGGEKSGLRSDGQPKAAVPTRAVALPAVDAAIEQAVGEAQIPGAVLIVGHHGQVIYRKAYGSRALEPRREAMTLDTVFDLASLTKVIATTTAVMQLVERWRSICRSLRRTGRTTLRCGSCWSTSLALSRI